MKTLIAALITLSLATLAMGTRPTGSSIEIGKAAPAFELVNSQGEKVALADFKGKWVVLEWVNRGCPFVAKHYDTKNMQSLQKKYAAGKDEVVWLAICSSAPGKQGHMKEHEQINAWIKAQGAAMTHYLVDEDGKVGRAYQAATTPHMFVIDKEGKLAYQGAIDDKSSWRKSTVEGANNYVAAALEALKAGEKVELAKTKPYGCSVKY